MSPLNITQPLDSIRYMVYNGYYKVMSNIPKMGHLTTPGSCPRFESFDPKDPNRFNRATGLRRTIPDCEKRLIGTSGSGKHEWG